MFKKNYYLALFFIAYVIGWQWYIFHHIYPDRWYESFGHAMFTVVIAFSVMTLGAASCYLKEQMSSKKCVLYAFIIEIVFIVVSFRILYFGPVNKVTVEKNLVYFLIGAVFIFVLSRKSLYKIAYYLFDGEVNGVDINTELNLIKNGVFDDLKACVSITFMLIIFLLMMLYFKLRSL